MPQVIPFLISAGTAAAGAAGDYALGGGLGAALGKVGEGYITNQALGALTPKQGAQGLSPMQQYIQQLQQQRAQQNQMFSQQVKNNYMGVR